MLLGLAVLLAVQDVLKADSDKMCMECHAEQKEDWKTSIHAQSAIGCTACHGTDEVIPSRSKHLYRPTFNKGFTGKTRTVNYRSQSPDLCKKCHEAVFNEFKESSHHEKTVDVADGEKQEVKGCISCHEWHGTREADPRAIVNEACSKCHKEGSVQRLRGQAYAAAAAALENYLAGLSSKFRQPGVTWRKEEAVEKETHGILRLSAVKQHHATKTNLADLTAALKQAADRAGAAYSTLEQREREFGKRYFGLYVFLGLMAVNAGLVALWGRRRRRSA